MKIKQILILFVVIYTVNSAKILGVFHMCSYSHFLLGNTLLKALAEKGHEVTMISSFDQKPPIPNYRTILVPEIFDLIKGSQPMDMKQMSIIETIKAITEMTATVAELTLNNTNVQKLLKSDEKFDVVIIEQFMSESLRAFQYHYKIPCIVFSTIKATTWVNPLVGNPENPSYIPQLFSSFTEKMTFFERFQNSMMYLVGYLSQYLYGYEIHNKILHKYMPDAPHIHELIHNTSLILLNSDNSINQAIPLLPNMISVGGLHVKAPKKLPEDLQKHLDDAKDGVIYFSLGSNLKSKDLSIAKRDAIINTFSKLKMQVLWKWEDEALPGQTKNIKIQKWLPQQDILAHPNVKLFITHGGFLSTIETVYHGKPILGIPFFGDQQLNMRTAEYYGYGLSVDYDILTEETFSNALNEVLSNPKYTENVLKRSKILHDQPMKPLERAMFWVEYVIRHKGALHFRSSALELNWFQYLLLDVICFVIGCLLFIFIAIYLLLKGLGSVIFKKQNYNVPSSKKTK